MKPIRLTVLLLIIASVFTAKSPALNESIPEVSIEKLEGTPDLMQNLPEAALPWGGMAHCGLVSASNSILWLARHGFDRLVVPFDESPRAQGRLATLLGSKRYMHTTKQNGTGVRR